jgi:molybdopterin molybdotransferase
MSPATGPFDDVRMRGFARRSTVAEAIAWIDARVPRLSNESIPLDTSAGRVLARPVISGIDVPMFDRAAMDGYAVRAEETTGADLYQPVSLRVVGESLPGRPAGVSVNRGEAVRIMTGAPLPAGADAVVPSEHARESGEHVELTAAVPVGKHVGLRGEDIPAGTIVLSEGRVLRPQDLGLLASIGRSSVEVIRRPRVRVIVTGNELVPPGEARGPYQIYDANSFQLAALVARDGGALESLQRVGDQRDRIAAALNAPGADVVLISGGSSVGAEDHAPSLLAEAGELAVHGVAMRPSSPTGMGWLHEWPVFLLPGNPVSCLCAYDFFARRAIRLLGGRLPEWPYRQSTEVVMRKIVSAVGRVDYCRVRRDEGGIVPLAISGASMLSSTTRADGFVVIPAESEGLPPGMSVTVWWYDI